MNRALLIIICDFLLLSLLSLARFDVQEQEASPGVMTPDYAAGSSDLVEVLKLALEEERVARQQLSGELGRTLQTVEEQQQALSQREQHLQAVQRGLQETEAEARRLASEQAALHQEFTSAQKTLRTLKTELADASTATLLSEEKVAALEKELRQRQDETEQMQRKLAELEQSHHATQAEKQTLVTQLQVAETEKRLTQERLSEMRGEVQVVREEKARVQEQAAKLADGVSALAERSGELTEEIRQNRPLSANFIFQEFYTNRVQTRFEARRTGVLNRDVQREKLTDTILITDGAGIFALYHVDETPLALAQGPDWASLTGVLRRENAAFSLVRLSFAAVDPRIVLVPVGEPQARQLGSKIYRVASDPFRFSEAVLVGATEGYYGEARFSLDPNTPSHVRMDRSLFRGIFGRFNPSRGDLVLSKTGELLGIMVNNDYCAVLNDLTAARTLPFGPDISAHQSGQVMTQLRARVDRFPFPLQ